MWKENYLREKKNNPTQLKGEQEWNKICPSNLCKELQIILMPTLCITQHQPFGKCVQNGDDIASGSEKYLANDNAACIHLKRFSRLDASKIKLLPGSLMLTF